MTLLCGAAHAIGGCGGEGTPALDASTQPAAADPSSPAIASGGTPATCAPAVEGMDATLKSQSDAIRQAPLVLYGGLHPMHAPLWRLLPTLSKTGRVASIAATFSDDANGAVVHAVLLDVTTEEPGKAAVTSLHLGLAAPACKGGDLALLGPTIPIAETATGAITLVQPVELATGDVLTSLWIETTPYAEAERNDKSISIAVVGARGKGHVAATMGDYAVVGVMKGLSTVATSGGDQRRDELLVGSGWYPSAEGGVHVSLHRATESTPGDAKPGFSPPRFRLDATVDATGLHTGGAAARAGYLIGVTGNPPPEGCPKPIVDGRPRVCLGVSNMDAYVRGKNPQWLIGSFDDHDAAKSAARALGIPNAPIYRTEPPAGTAVVANDAPFALPGTAPPVSSIFDARM